MAENAYRVAPAGFTKEQWKTFLRDGIIIIEDALSHNEIEEYLAAIDRLTDADPNYKEGDRFYRQNFVELDPTLAGLIDHPRHVGYAYDIYGELLKLHETQLFLREPMQVQRNKWHPDGARVVPYGVFSPVLPLQIKVAYWLTDLPTTDMGNLVVLPGSHRTQYQEAYDTYDTLPGELILQVPAGTMTVMHSSIWHKVEPNLSKVTRKNFFIAYCPAWVTAADRIHSDPGWLKTLNREQRIIMRNYTYGYDYAKPPPEDFPLFLDRETGLDHDPDMYHERVVMERRKRLTFHEKLELAQAGA